MKKSVFGRLKVNAPLTILSWCGCLLAGRQMGVAAPPPGPLPSLRNIPLIDRRFTSRDVFTRQVTCLNRDWRFILKDPTGAELPAYDDSAWQSVGLPHSFSIPYFLGTRFPVGSGWYRKKLDLPGYPKGAPDPSHRYFLEFDGVFQVAEVYVNGLLAGTHRGGYTGFSVDITGSLHTGNNVIAVRVNNLWDPELAPRAGEHVFSGGIYRDVRLVETNEVHIPWNGTFITTPGVSAHSAVVDAKVDVENDAVKPVICTVEETLISPEGQQVATWSTTGTLAAGATATFDTTSNPISRPELWDPDHPNLYRIRTTVSDSGWVVDEIESHLGIRWFQWTPDQGFFLNGKHLYIIGANVHQDQAGWGDAVTDAAARRDVKMIKDAGFNFIRGSHYPHSPAFVDACDEYGVMLWSEGDFWGTGGRTADGFWSASAYPLKDEQDQPFEDSTIQQHLEMIQILRNHPSIVAWSTGNEDFFVPSDRLPKVRDFLKRLAAAMRAADPTRPTAMGGVQRGDLDKLDGSIAGYNGDGARLFLNPGVPNLVSEYGSTIANRPGNYAPGYGDLLQGPGDRSVPYYWRYPWRSGEVIWCGFDHGSIASIPFGSMGLIDYFRLPKRQYYWYRNELLQTPPPAWPQAGTPAKLRLESDHTTISGTDATDDVHLVCTVLDVNSVPISNSPPVTLTVVSGPGEFPTGQSITFTLDSDIAIRDGQCAIAMRSYYAGPSVIQAASPGLEPASITINTTGTQLFVPGVTPPPEPHPYTRYVAPPGAADATVFCVSSERPTEASSEAPGHPAKFANDADPTTWWQPAAGDAHPWWGVDLENTYRIQRVSITFPTAGNYRYVVQVSPDKTTWTTVDDESASNLTDQTRTDSGNFGSGMRFLRIQVTGVPVGAPAGIAEVAVFGGN